MAINNAALIKNGKNRYYFESRGSCYFLLHGPYAAYLGLWVLVGGEDKASNESHGNFFK